MATENQIKMLKKIAFNVYTPVNGTMPANIGAGLTEEGYKLLCESMK